MIDVDQMILLLGKSRQDPQVLTFAENVGGGEVEEIEDVWFFSFRKAGFSFRFDNDALTSIEFYVRGDRQGGFKPYTGPLPHGLQASLDREQVAAMIGKPVVSKPMWEMHLFNDHVVHVGYDDKAKIQSVTLLSLQADVVKRLLKKK